MIREATVDDAAMLASLVTELGYPSTEAELRHRLEHLATEDRATFVFEHDGRVLGMIGLLRHAYYERDGHGTEIAALVVTEGARSRGVGKALVEAGERWAKVRGCDIVWLNSGLRRQDAHRFYRNAGYTDTGLRFTKEI